MGSRFGCPSMYFCMYITSTQDTYATHSTLFVAHFIFTSTNSRGRLNRLRCRDNLAVEWCQIPDRDETRSLSYLQDSTSTVEFQWVYNVLSPFERRVLRGALSQKNRCRLQMTVSVVEGKALYA